MLKCSTTMIMLSCLQGQMMMQDKLEKERADSKNSVEEYVYEMRNKLSSELEMFMKEEVRTRSSFPVLEFLPEEFKLFFPDFRAFIS